MTYLVSNEEICRQTDEIVHQLRSKGWDRHDAMEEADRIVSERLKRRIAKSLEPLIGEPLTDENVDKMADLVIKAVEGCE